MLRFRVRSSRFRGGLTPGRVTAIVLHMLVCASFPIGAQAGNLEAGTVIAAGNVIWVRATTQGSVAFFMSQGYRDALARPSLMDANRLLAWTDSAKALQVPATGVSDVRTPADTGLTFDRWVGTDSSGLEIERDGSTILRVSDTPARELVDLLARGAEMARRVSAPVEPAVAAAPATPRVDTAAAPAAPHLDTAPAPAATISMRQVAVASPLASSVAAPVASPAAPASSPVVLPVLAPVAAPAAPSARADVQPESAAPAPPDSTPVEPVRAPSLEPSLDSSVRREASPAAATLVGRSQAVLVADVKAEPLPPVTPLDKRVDTPLGPFVVPAAKLVDRDTQIRYCYTELGLRYDRHLTGDVTVRVSLDGAGVADTVEVTKRTWDGVAAAEVESCMRALIADWSFDDRQPPDARTVELHFTLSPAMRTATTDGAHDSAQPR